MNFDNKVIGIHLTHVKRTDSFFIPLKPSSLYKDVDFDYIDDSIWTDFTTTQKNLLSFHKKTNGKVTCQPKRIVVEDRMIVGILTESNQFVKINEPLPVNELPDQGKELKKKYFYNITDLDKELFLNENIEDKERKRFIRNLRLEKQFYNAYVNTIQYHIHDEKNIELKQRIKDIVQNDEDSFESKFNSLYGIISKETETLMHFGTYVSEDVLNQIDEVNMCGEKEEVYCTKMENDHNQLFIPERNLYTQEENQIKYPSDLTHDLLLNTNIQKQLLQTAYSLFQPHVNYKLSKTELILLEKQLKPYLKSLGDKHRSIKVSHDVYEELEPQDIANLVAYNEVIPVDEESEEENIFEDHTDDDVEVDEDDDIEVEEDDDDEDDEDDEEDEEEDDLDEKKTPLEMAQSVNPPLPPPPPAEVKESPSPTYQELREQQGYSPLKDLIIDENDNKLSESQSPNVVEADVKDETKEQATPEADAQKAVQVPA